MKSLNNEQLQFFMNEVLGELNWGDEDDASGMDPLNFVRAEIRAMRTKIKRLQGSLELRDAAQYLLALDAAYRCPCGALHEERGVYCDVCGADTPRQ